MVLGCKLQELVSAASNKGDCLLTWIDGIRKAMQVCALDDSNNGRQHRHAHQDAQTNLSRPLHLKIPESSDRYYR